MIKSGIQLAEKGYIPDFILKQAINQLLKGRLNQIPKVDDLKTSSKLSFFEELKNSPIAISTNEANEQHYELPPSFFDIVLGSNLKYSSGYWPTNQTTFDESEVEMLELSCKRAELEDKLDILELGCGWGSLSLWMAKNFPKSKITSVSFNKQKKLTREIKRAKILGLL